jgi:hypothetical protein
VWIAELVNPRGGEDRFQLQVVEYPLGKVTTPDIAHAPVHCGHASD